MRWWSAGDDPPKRAAVRLDGSLEKWASYREDIYFLVLATDEALVYLDSENDVEWTTSEDYDWDADTDEFNAILNRAAILEAMPCDGLDMAMRRHFKRLIGEGVARAVEKDFELAKSALDSAEAYVRARTQERSRFWYLSASTAMTAPFVAMVLVFWISRSALIETLGSNAFWVAMGACFGGIGALLSVIVRTGQMNFDSSSGRPTHFLEGASRIWAGVLSGVVVVLAVQAGLVFAAFSHGKPGASLAMLAALASGASERLATSILSQVGIGKQDEKTAGRADRT